MQHNFNNPNFAAHHQQQPANQYRPQQEFAPQQQRSPSPVSQPQRIQQQQPPTTFSAQNNLVHLKAQAQMQMQNQFRQTHQQPFRQQAAPRTGPNFCPKYQEPYVGYCEGELVCNSMIYEKKLQSVKFLAIVSKELKGEFGDKFVAYKQGINAINGVDPNLVKQRATIMVKSYFQALSQRVGNLQREVMNRIKNSDSLRELEKICEQNKEFIPDGSQKQDQFEKEKKIFDEKIGKGRFAYLVKRQEFYRDLIESLESSSARMKQTLTHSADQVNRVVQMKTDEDLVARKLSQIVQDSITVDMRPLDPQQRSQSTPPTFAQRMQQQAPPQQQPQVPAPLQQVPAFQQQRPGLFSNVAPPKQNEPISPRVQHGTFSPIQQKPQVTHAATPPQISPQKPVAEAPASPQQSVSSQSQHSAKAAAADSQDDVVITSVQPAKQPEFTIRPELNFRTTYKLKAMSLLKLIPGRGWAKINEFKDHFLSKCVQTPNENAYVIGGARDNKSQSTLGDVVMHAVYNNGKVETKNCASMINSRSSFGCTVNIIRDEIYVAGGYTNGVLTRNCEAYSIKDDRWRELPPLNEEKCSNTLCVLNGRYLYSLGGLAKSEGGAYLLSSIEMLDLQAPSPKWTMLAIKLPHQVCDLGAVPLSPTNMLLFGGWNKTSLQTAFVMRIHGSVEAPMHQFCQVANGLDKPDFFLVSGVAMKQDPQAEKIKVCGHTQLFTYNTKTNSFEGSSVM